MVFVYKARAYIGGYKLLIKWATENDLPAWYVLATEVSDVFQHPADMGVELRNKASGIGSVSRYEMLTAVDYMSSDNIGFICFSRTENAITWFAVSEKHRGKGAGAMLKWQRRKTYGCNVLTRILMYYTHDYCVSTQV